MIYTKLIIMSFGAVCKCTLGTRVHVCWNANCLILNTSLSLSIGTYVEMKKLQDEKEREAVKAEEKDSNMLEKVEAAVDEGR